MAARLIKMKKVLFSVMEEQGNNKRRPHSPLAYVIKVYDAGEGKLFSPVYSQGPTLRVANPLLKQHARGGPVGHTVYVNNAGRDAWITTYVLEASLSELAEIQRKTHKSLLVSSLEEDLSAKVDRDYGIRSRHLSLGDLEASFVQSIRHDVKTHCERAERGDNHAYELFPSQEPETPQKRRRGRKLFTGETGFVQVERLEHGLESKLVRASATSIIKPAKGTLHEICPLQLGIDVSLGCVSTMTSDGWYDPSGKCSYCYAYQNGPCFRETVYALEEEAFTVMLKNRIAQQGLDRGRLHLRLGQTSEAFIAGTLAERFGVPDVLSPVLGGIAHLRKKGYDIRVAMPTKTPQYSPEITDLLRAAGVSVLVSFGDERKERGINQLGFTPERRLEEARRLANAGVNTNLYLVVDITRGIDAIHSTARQALAFAERHALGVQFLDVRVTKKEDAMDLVGAEWGMALGNPAQTGLWAVSGAGQGRFQKTEQSYLAAIRTHPDFLKYTAPRGDRRLCSTHVLDGTQQCGYCFMDRS